MLHVLVGATCNNNCLFCMEADRSGRAVHIRAQSKADIRSMIFSYPRTDEILFTSGEPTLCPDLPEYVRWARERGFRVIGLISNGRRLAYGNYLDELVALGLNRATISIHGHTPALHDGLTRAPGSYAQTRKALDNLARRKARSNLRVHTSTVITRRNLAALPDIHALLWAADVDQMVFNVMMAKGRGAEHFAALMPRYGDVIDAFTALVASSTAPMAQRIRVVDMPPCILLRLPAAIRGELEDFDQYEAIGSTGVSELCVLNPASASGPPKPAANASAKRAGALSNIFARGGVRGWLDHNRRRLASLAGLGKRRETYEPALEAFASRPEVAHDVRVIDDVRKAVSKGRLAQDGAYYVTSRRFKDRFLRMKGPPCATCAARNACAGVWEPYVERYGWDEFAPVAGPMIDTPTHEP